MAEVHLTAEHKVLDNEQQHAEQPELNNKVRVDYDAEQRQVKSLLLDPSPDNKITEFLNQSLESENISLKKIVAQFQNVLSKMEHIVSDSGNGRCECNIEKRIKKVKRNSVDTKFAKPSILGKPVLQPHINQCVVRQSNAFQSEQQKFSKLRFASQVGVKNDLPKPVSPNYLGKVQESVLAKPHHVIASGSSMNRIRHKLLSPRTISSGLVPQPPSPTPNVSPTKNDWDSLFFPMFDEYFNHSPSVVQHVLIAVVQEPAVSTGTPSSTRIDQDTPSTSTLQTTQEEQSHVILLSVEEDDHGIEVAHMDNDM
ncbi:hypothetical protein Tco_0887363 [Tanacetum coccineum]